MKIVVVDYGYCSGSHHYSSACSLAEAARRAGVGFRLLAPRASDLVGRPGPAADFVLSFRLYDFPLGERRRVGRFWSAFSARRAAVRRDLDAQLAARMAPSDTVLLATPMAPEFAGFADWHAALAPERRSAVAVHFLLPLGYELAADLAWQEDFALLAHGEAFARLRASAGARSLYLAHPAPLAERLAAFDPRLAVFPSPSALPEPAPAAADVPTVAFLGRGKAVKGIDLAFAAFDRLQAAGAPLRWIFQTAPLALDARRRAALAAPNVRHVCEFATHAEYRDLLRESSIVVLPYRPDAYGSDQGSGVLCEALAMGIPVVCSEAAFFAAQLARLGCPELVFRPYSAEALAAKIAEVAREYPRYRARFAAEAGVAALSPARLIERLCAVARAAPGPAGAEAAAGPRANGAARSASLLSLLDIRLRALAGRPNQ